MVGTLIYESEELCSHLISGQQKSAELQVLASLQRILVESRGFNHRTTESVMWTLSNISLNSIADLDAILKSGILANVSIACNDPIRSTRTEAINTICNVVVKLANENEQARLRDLFTAYSIELTLIEVLRNDINNH